MKIERQAKIVQLVKEKEIETQEELAELLLAEGFLVTQATISRDIRDLKLTKVTISGGKQKYAVLNEASSILSDKYLRVFRDGYLGMTRAGNLIVVKTLSGMAMSVAAAIDAIQFESIAGTIAGDDTIFCAIESEEKIIHVMEEFNRIAKGLKN